MRRLASPTIAIALLLGPSFSSAQTSIAVLGIEATDAPASFASCISDGIKAETRKASGFRLVPGKDLDEIKLVFGCVEEEPDCMARVGKTLQASKLLWGSLKKSGASFNLTLKLLDVAEARIEKFATENLKKGELTTGCAKKTIGRILTSLIATKKAEIKVAVNMVGAQVLLDSHVVGVSDKEPVSIKDLSPGSHVVTVKKEGFQSFEQTIEIRGDESIELNASLVEERAIKPPVEPPPASQPVSTKSKLGWRIAFWTGVAVSVGFFVATAVTGKSVLDYQKDKDQEIKALQQAWIVNKTSGPVPFQSDDACNETTSYKDGTAKLIGICDTGRSKALLTNIFTGIAIGVLAVSGIFYYKAYIADNSPSEKDTSEGKKQTRAKPPSVEWSLSPNLGPLGGGLGFSLRY